MLTGINFSPPLYFLFNFCIQLVFPTSIEQLRIQSLIFIITGIVLSFLLARRFFGSTTALVATILITSQSYLLLSQALEARHYAMFFACGAWVLYSQSLRDAAVKKYTWLTFLSHFCLCQVHYLGIIFSFLNGVAYFLTSKNKDLWKRIPTPITLCWISCIVSYLFYLTKQKSVLNTWPKPNQLSDLLAGFNDSLLILTILIPLLVFILINKSDRTPKTRSFDEIQFSKPILLTSILWLSVPFIFWVMSHLSSMNLFVERYFIPKESALIFLVAYGFSLILQKLNQQNLKKNIPFLGIFGISLILILVSTKRAAFGLNKDTNYHHSLIIEKTYPTSMQPINLEGDPKYFPNAYLGHNQYVFLISDDHLLDIYSRYSKKLIYRSK